MDAALAVLEVLAPNATAQPLTSFTHFLAEPDPGQQRQVVFVDNGRSRIARDERYREVLKCIRCGACMNGCPVYRAAGGLSYGSPYMGPIGAVLSPLLWRDGRYADLPFASSLCGACTEACPVGIPLHRMLLDLRADAVENGQAGGRLEKAAWIGWAATFSGATRARAASALGRIGLRSTAHIIRPKGDADDPRMLPEPDAAHDPLLVTSATERRTPDAVITVDDIAPADDVELFIERARQLGITVVEKLKTKKDDRILDATAAIASTGSVLLTGEATARRPLLAAARVVVRVKKGTIVHFPSDIAPYLGDTNALILTGASRTADIEKKLVRGIHGAEEMVIVLG
jgi:ferredoxin